MMNEQMMKKMEQLLANEEFAADIQAMTSLEEIHAHLMEKGIEIPFGEFRAAYEQVRKEEAAAQEEELTADTLDAVSGGCKHTAARYLAMAKNYAKRGNYLKAAAMYARYAIELSRPCYHW